MTRRDRHFALGTVALSVVLPGLLLALRPFDEARAELGLLCGWGVALAIMVPSYVLLSRTLGSADSRTFLGGFLGGSLGRLVLTAVAVVLFVKLVPEAPAGSFLVAYFLGYFSLTVLELMLTLRRQPEGRGA
jgi:hypothetical protein